MRSRRGIDGDTAAANRYATALGGRIADFASAVDRVEIPDQPKTPEPGQGEDATPSEEGTSGANDSAPVVTFIDSPEHRIEQQLAELRAEHGIPAPSTSYVSTSEKKTEQQVVVEYLSADQKQAVQIMKLDSSAPLTQEELEAQYRRLLRILHPDRWAAQPTQKKQAAARRLAMVQDAYNLLSKMFQ